ncbi:WGR domain-containing protein [Phyllobacterium sp. P30BS-XVII]
MRNWGRIGTRGQQKVDTFSNSSALQKAFERLAQQKCRKGNK